MNNRLRVAPLLACFALIGCKKEAVVEVPVVAAPKPAPAPAAHPTGLKIELKVTGEGFEPAKFAVKVNEPVTLVVTRTTDETCATDLLIDGTDINVPLPLNTPVEIAWTPTKTGAVKYGCAMDKMIGGMVLVE